MIVDTRLVATPFGIRLCPLADLAEDGARNFVIRIRSGRFHGFVVRRGATVHGYLDRCPHAGVPLARELDQYLTCDLPTCRHAGPRRSSAAIREHIVDDMPTLC